MSMRFYYGGYAFPEGTIRSAVRLNNSHDERGNVTEQTLEWTLRGELLADGQAAVVAAQIALENALRNPRQNVILRTSTGQVAQSMTNTASIGGVRVTSLEYPEGVDGFEFVSGRTFAVTFHATYSRLTGAGGTQLLTFTETVETFGGGPVTGFMRPVNAQPLPVTLYSHSVFEAAQVGQATCLLGYWPAPSPTLGVPIEAPRIARTCDGKVYTTNWSYRFQKANGPFVGLPTIIR